MEYSAKGDFTDAVVIDAGFVTSGTGSYTLSPVWTAPFTVADTYKVRVSNVSPPAGTGLSYSSAQAFKVRPTITSVTSPASGAVWKVGETNRTVTWNSVSGNKTDATAPKVQIDYRVDTGLWNSVTTNLSNANGSNSFNWTGGVADEKSENAEIRVAFQDYTSVANLSASFKIRPNITVTAPNGSTQLLVGSTYSNLIKWTYTGTKTTDVDIKYDTANGTGGYTGTIATSQAVASGTAGVTWGPIPDIVGTQVKVKVVDSGAATVYGESAAFKVKGGLTLTAPTAGAAVTAGTTNTISWNYSGTIANVKLYYSMDSGSNYTFIDTKSQAGCSGGTCSYAWDAAFAVPVPDVVTNTARIKITNAADETDVSSEGSDFKFGASFTSLLPANGSVILAGSTATNVTWTKVKGPQSATKVKIEHTKNQSSGTPTWADITPVGGTDNTGSFLWPTVPGDLTSLGNDNKLRITQYNPANNSATLTGTGVFLIKGAITVTAPAGNESWGAGTAQSIKFTKKGALQTVNIYYAPDGVTYQGSPLNGSPIDVSALADDTETTWTWNVGANEALTAGLVGKIKVAVVTPATQAAPIVEKASTGGFQVKGSIATVTPTAQTDLVVAGTKAITWVPSGAISKFKIEYQHSGGSWVEITPNGGVTGGVPATRTWDWTSIPDQIGSDILIRVSDYDN